MSVDTTAVLVLTLAVLLPRRCVGAQLHLRQYQPEDQQHPHHQARHRRGAAAAPPCTQDELLLANGEQCGGIDCIATYWKEGLGYFNPSTRRCEAYVMLVSPLLVIVLLIPSLSFPFLSSFLFVVHDVPIRPFLNTSVRSVRKKKKKGEGRNEMESTCVVVCFFTSSPFFFFSLRQLALSTFNHFLSLCGGWMLHIAWRSFQAQRNVLYHNSTFLETVRWSQSI